MRGAMRHIPVFGVLCAIAAVSLGLIYLYLAGAPFSMLFVNAGALALGLLALTFFQPIASRLQLYPGIVALLFSLIMLLTALLGPQIDGIRRWIVIGPLSLQPSLIGLPLMVLIFARYRNRVATLAMGLVALALALQPDRAMAGVLWFGMMGCALYRFDGPVKIAGTSASVAFLIACLRPDPLEAAPFVEGILYAAFDVGPFAGLAVVGGLAMLLVPAFVGWARHSEGRGIYAIFAALWAAVIVASALGHYPTPVVGYGSSAILGYVLSLAGMGLILAQNSR